MKFIRKKNHNFAEGVSSSLGEVSSSMDITNFKSSTPQSLYAKIDKDAQEIAENRIEDPSEIGPFKRIIAKDLIKEFDKNGFYFPANTGEDVVVAFENLPYNKIADYMKRADSARRSLKINDFQSLKP